MGAVVGIDLGTTNTVVAAVRDGTPAALPDESGSTLIPSIVSFLPSGAVLVGSAAKERRSEDARNTIYSVKRLIGRTWDSPEVREATTRFPFELREGPGRATFVIARGETYTLPEISAFVLRKAKSIAELELGEPVDRAVITVPANFNDLQRAATKVAGRVAGLEVLRILNEPTAAALAFGHTRGNRARIAIYDFGGGTFDLTLLLLTDDVFEVLSTAGDTFLGGDDIDATIVNRMLSQLPTDLGGRLRAQPETLERLRDAAENLKLKLSEASDAAIHLDDNEVGGTVGLDFAMSRADLDRIVEPIVTRTFKVCHDALTTAKLGPRDIDHVLLVGGTTRIPLVRRKVEEYFGRSARADVDPHEVVALGAARQAMALTQLRATASGMPIAPPPRPALGSSSSEAMAGGDTQADAEPARQQTAPFGPLRKQTDPGVGDGDESVQPVRVSVVPPEGPLSHPAPTTQNFGTRERRTTGVGIGPSDPVPTLAGTAQSATTPETRSPAVAASALAGTGANKTGEKSTSPSLPRGSLATRPDLEDLPLPLVPSAAQPTRGADKAAAAPRREFTRSPAVRVTRGTEPQSALTSTLSSSGNTTNRRVDEESSPGTDPLFDALVHPTSPAKTEAGPTTDPLFGVDARKGVSTAAASSPHTDPLFGAVVRPTSSATAESSPATDPLFGTGARPAASLSAAAQDAAALGARGKPAQKTIPDEAGAWDEPPDDAAELGLPLVTASPRLAPERRAVTSLGQDAPQTAAPARPALPAVTTDLLADLPLVVAQPVSLPTRQRTQPSTDSRDLFAKTETSASMALGLPDPRDNEAGGQDNEDQEDFQDSSDDEPTVIRRSQRSSSELGEIDPAILALHDDDLPERSSHDLVDEPSDLPTPVSAPAPSSAAPSSSRRSGKPTSLTEDEIRARYGNLPLIVGGKRVGPRTTESVAEPTSAAGSRRPLPSNEAASAGRAPPNALTAAQPQIPKAREPLATAAEVTPQALATTTRHPKPGPVVPGPLPLPRLPNLVTPSAADIRTIEPQYVEPEPLEPEYIEPDSDEPVSSSSAPKPIALETPLPDETVPKSQRLHSTRPAARQDSAAEFELPIPDLPPQRPLPAPAAAPMASTRPLPQTRALAGADPVGVTPARTPQRDPNWGAAAFNATLPLGAAGLTTGAWQPPTSAAATGDAGAPAAAPTQPFEVPSLLASLPKSSSMRPALLIDVTPLSLCVETVSGYVDTLIARNTPVPCERTRDFVTAHDNQQSVVVRVAQGESKQFQENLLLGEVQLTGIPPALRGQSRIAVTFGIDSDGILHVRALDVTSGKSAQADLRLQGAPSSPEVAQMMARHAAKPHA